MDTAVPASGHSEHAATTHIDEDRKVRLGMFFYVLTDATFVIFMLVSYPWLRAYNTDSGWFPFPGMRLPDATTSLILVLIMVASAVCYGVGYFGIRSGNQWVLRIGMLLALVLVLITLVGQIRFMGSQQFSTGDGTFADTWLLFSGYHIYHLLWATFLGIGVTNRAFQGRYTQARHLGVVTIGYFWAWAALTPILVFLLVVLLPPR